MTRTEAGDTAQPPLRNRDQDVTPEKASSKKGAKACKGAPKGRNAAKGAKAKAAAKKAGPKAQNAKNQPTVKKTTTPAAGEARDGSKKSIILGLLRRKDGWQNHSIRGFISGTLGKRMGLTVESSKNTAGERVYRLAK